MDLIPKGGTLCTQIIKLVKYSIFRHQESSKIDIWRLELLYLMSAIYPNLGNPFILIYLPMRKKQGINIDIYGVLIPPPYPILIDLQWFWVILSSILFSSVGSLQLPVGLVSVSCVSHNPISICT